MRTSYKKARHAAPNDGLSTFKKVTAVVVAGLAITISALSAASDGKTAYITDNGNTYTVAADSDDVSLLLAEAGIKLNSGDVTTVTEESGDSISIDIKRAFKVNITADGSTRQIDLTEGTAADAIKAAGLTVSPNDIVKPALDTVLEGDTDITVTRCVKIYLERSGETKHAYVPEGTVGEALKTVGCELCSEGNENIKADTPVRSGMKICVDNVLYRTTTKNETVEPTVIEEACPTLPLGEKTVKQEGKQGKIEITYKEKYVNGELVSKKEDKTNVIVKPVSKIILIGTKPEPLTDSEVKTEASADKETSSVFADFGSAPSLETKKTTSTIESSGETFGEASDNGGESFSYNTLITGMCTAYNEINGITAVGTAPKVGTVAVNPDVIPYGTRLYICSADGSYVYGYAIAEDTGTACMAGDIVVDLYMNSEEECDDFGRRELNIYILD